MLGCGERDTSLNTPLRFNNPSALPFPGSFSPPSFSSFSFCGKQKVAGFKTFSDPVSDLCTPVVRDFSLLDGSSVLFFYSSSPVCRISLRIPRYPPPSVCTAVPRERSAFVSFFSMSCCSVCDVLVSVGAVFPFYVMLSLMENQARINSFFYGPCRQRRR